MKEGRKLARKIVWHCECGHDFEVETEFRQDRCPKCGGTDIERVEVQSRWSKFIGGAKKNDRPRRWR